MMWLAETMRVIAPEQYCSQKFCGAIDHALNKILVIDLAEQKQTPLGIYSCNLNSCYDSYTSMMSTY